MYYMQPGPSGHGYCPYCGNRLDAAKVCPCCGTTVAANAKFCHNCGTQFGYPALPPQTRRLPANDYYEEAYYEPAYEAPRTQARPRPAAKRRGNVPSLVLAILGALFGIIGAILWATVADFAGAVVGGFGGDNSTQTVYLVCFIVLGVGGALLSLIGGICAHVGKRGAGIGLSVVGFLFQIGSFVTQCVAVSGVDFLFSLPTMLAIVLLLIATCFSGRRAK